MSRSYTPLPPSASMACRGTALLYFYFFIYCTLFNNAIWFFEEGTKFLSTVYMNFAVKWFNRQGTVLTTMLFCWVMTSSRLVCTNRCLPACLHCVTTQKNSVIFTASTASNLSQCIDNFFFNLRFQHST
jgi:hypothetical protein